MAVDLLFLPQHLKLNKIMNNKVENIIEQDIKEISDSLGKLAYKLEGKIIVITGGSGFLGRYILGTLIYLNKFVLGKPCVIISIDNNITSSGSKISGSEKYVKYINRDVTKSLNLPGKIDYIMHAAGIASPIYYQKYQLETIDVAVGGTRNMLELARKKKIKSFLFFSSSEIYGDPTPDAIPTKETYNGNVSSIGPRSCYDESKRLGETLCMTYYSVYKTPVKMVRPFNVYGPGLRSNDYRVIPTFIFNGIRGKIIPVHANGKQTRTFCYISDAVAGFFKVLLSDKNGEVYNVGNDDNEIDMNKLAKILNKLFNNELKIRNISYPRDYPQGEPQRRCPDLSKIRKELEYKPKVNLEEGLRRTLVWSRQNWK
mgnify:CR=1 FL=1